MVKKFLLFLSCIIIIVFSFIMPKLLLQLEDLSREKEIFVRPKKESKIDVQAENIYLVRFIHEIFNLKNETIYYTKGSLATVILPMTEKSINTFPTEELKNEISKLVSSNIIKDINFDEFDDFDETINTFTFDYLVITSNLENKDGKTIGVNIEEKTGKIISIDFSKDILRGNIDKKEQLENYVKYLDLDIIDDWKYEDDILKSEKAQLNIVLKEEKNFYMLAIMPIDAYKEYKILEHGNTIVEKSK